MLLVGVNGSSILMDLQIILDLKIFGKSKILKIKQVDLGIIYMSFKIKIGELL